MSLTRDCTAACRAPPVESEVPLSAVRLKLKANYPGMRLAVANPPIYLCDDFLSPAECDALVAVAAPRMARSKIGSKISDVRTSTTCLLPHDEDAAAGSASAAITSKIRRLTGKSLKCMENVQVARYERGQHYESHYDGASPHEPTGFEFMSMGGQRLCTVRTRLQPVEPS